MRTSASQFDLMVTYMEQHGDLTKPSNTARGRLTTMNHWEDLTNLLNSDGSGSTKDTERWKRVWSDFKGNTKKKAARLHRASIGTGGGPACFAKLTDLEHRVLSLIGVQVATGLAVDEAGLSQVNQIRPPQFVENSQDLYEPGSSRHIASPIFMFGSRPWNAPGPSTEPHTAPPLSLSQVRPAASPLQFVEVEVENTSMSTPPRPSAQDYTARPGPSLSGQTPPRYTTPRPSAQVHMALPGRALFGRTSPHRTRLTQAREPPQRRVRPAHTEQAVQHFLQADENWRNFKIQQHQDFMDMRRNQIRIREIEVQAQREWQARALDMLEKLVNKFCKD